MITYFTNGIQTTKSMTEWYFGKQTVANLTASSKRMNKKTGESRFDYWKNGTGRLTIFVR